MVYKTTRKVYAPKKSKRWYVNATAELPKIFGGGKAGISFGDGLQKRALVNTIKKVTHGEAEKKIKLVSNLSQAMLHSTGYTYNLLGNIAQGNTEETRIGEKINVRSFSFKGHIFTAAATVNSTFVRCILVKHDTETGGAVDTFVSGLGSSDLFYNFSNALLAQIDPRETGTVLMDRIIKLEPQSASVATIVGQTFSFKHTFNQNFQYKDGSNYSQKSNWYLYVISHVEGGSTGVTATATIEGSTVLKFTDL